METDFDGGRGASPRNARSQWGGGVFSEDGRRRAVTGLALKKLLDHHGIWEASWPSKMKLSRVK